MDDFNELEEPPPIQRVVKPAEKTRLFGSKSDRSSPKSDGSAGKVDWAAAKADWSATKPDGPATKPDGSAGKVDWSAAKADFSRTKPDWSNTKPVRASTPSTPSIPSVPSPLSPPSAPLPSASYSASYSAAPAGRDSRPVAQTDSGAGGLLALAALVVVLVVQGWLLLSARSDLKDLRARLDQTKSSVGQVWETAKGLDQDRMGRLDQLADSVRLAFEFAQNESRLSAERLEESSRVVSALLDDFTRTQLSRLDVVERQNRTYSSAFEALSRRAQSQETSTRDFNSSIASLRASLSRLDSDLAAVEQRQAGSTLTFGQLSRRVESLASWADGYRQAGLSGDFVLGRFSAFSDELRRIRIRVDSLRPMGRAVSSSETR